MLVNIEAHVLIFPGTDFYFPSTTVPPGTFFRLWSSDMTNATNEISLEQLTVSKDDDSFVDFVLRPLNRNFFSNEKSCTVRCFIPLRTGRVRIVHVKFNHGKLLLAVCDNVIHRDVVVLAELNQ